MNKARIIPYPNAEEVRPEHRNQIIVAQIVKLDPPIIDRFQEECTIVKQYPYEVINDGNEQLCDNWLGASFYFCPISQYDVDKFDAVQVDALQPDWFHNATLEGTYFERFYKTDSVGCPHYISGALLQCSICGKFYGCRHCHDAEVFDHNFGKQQTKMMKCRYCDAVQPFGCQCASCHRQLAVVWCPVCKFLCFIDQNAKPFFHCKRCNQCQCGAPEQYTHCDTCNLCINEANFSKHICAQHCSVCLEQFSNTYLSYRILQCGHMIHVNCHQKCIASQQYSCPLCRKTIFDEQELQEIRPKLRANAARDRLLNLEPYSLLATIHKCNDCGTQFLDCMMLANCSSCGTYNCEIIETASFGKWQEKIRTADLDYLEQQLDLVLEDLCEDLAELKAECNFNRELLLEEAFRTEISECETADEAKAVLLAFQEIE